MVDFYRQALRKIGKLDTEKHRGLLISAVNEINLLENVLNSIDAGILVCDGNNNLVMANKYVMRLLPVNFSEGADICGAIDDERIVEFLRQTLSNKDKVMDKEIVVAHNGRSLLLLLNILPLVQEKKITGSLLYIEDITEKRKTESRLRRAENLASLTTLAAGVAHEIKNPLGSISIHIQLLEKSLAKKRHSDEKTGKYINVIKEEMDRLNRTVVDFLFAVRTLTLELHEHDINKIIAEVMEFVKIEMEQSNILCLAELGENIPKILIDERLFKQALLNLIKNAQAAMQGGGVLTIATNIADNEIRIAVIDTGAGIDKENLARIFEPYFTTKETGTGLGLTQVYKIIREHQGEITVDSAPDVGSEFRIMLPIPQKETRMIVYNEKEKK